MNATPHTLDERLALAQQAESQREFAQAIAHYQRILEQSPFHTEALFTKAKLHCRQKEWELAQRLLNRLLESAPDNSPYIEQADKQLTQLAIHTGISTYRAPLVIFEK